MKSVTTIIIVITAVLGFAVGAATWPGIWQLATSGVGPETHTDPHTPSLPKTPGPEREDSPASYLAVISADSLTSAMADDGSQRVTLGGVDALGAWFTDRPGRKAGSANADTLIRAFVNKIPVDPPNVTIAMLSGGTSVTRIVTMSDVKWDGSTLSFTSTPLDNDPLGTLPGSASDVSVTLDSALNSCQLSINSSGIYQTVNAQTATQYGELLSLSGAAMGYEAEWQGTWDEGCSGSLTVDVTGANGEACGTATLAAWNPEFGDDGYTLSTSTAAVQVSLDESASVTSGSTPVWTAYATCPG